MRHQVIAAAILSLALAACSTAGVKLDEANKPVLVALTDEQKVIVYDGVKRALKDPVSAMFGDLRGVELRDGRIQVCGLVNSKNGFGGYAGMGPYEGFLDGNSFTVEAIDTPYAANMCSSFGVAV